MREENRMAPDRPGTEEGGSSSATPIYGVTAKTLAACLERFGAAAATYAMACGFKGERGHMLLLPGTDGTVVGVLFGVEAEDAKHHDPYLAGKMATMLPAGTYRFADGFADPRLSAIGFERGLYRYTRFRKASAPQPRLEHLAEDADEIALVAGAIAIGRDLINCPTNALGPDALEAAVRETAEAHGAVCTAIRGDDLLVRNLAMIHAVGRAATEAPRLVEFSWGDAAAPKVTLVGKGVCFDTGGLDIKPASAMLLMKKDMGGAATALSLAAMIMGASVRVRLRVLVPIVENAIAGNAFRPGDVLQSHKGLTVEVGNTDAEGRLILADALSLADEEEPELMVDFATLTGAARVALGPDLPAVFTDDDDLAAAIARHGAATNDPAWRMPLWQPYDSMLKSRIADLNNVSSGPFAGSITAALFLRRFVNRTRAWAHVDLYNWNPSTKPGRPEGGEIQCAYALFDLLRSRYGCRAGQPD